MKAAEILPPFLKQITPTEMKDIIRLFLAPILALAFIGCEQAGPEEEGKDLNQALTFQIEIMEVNANSAKLNVMHNGADTDTWYGFATTDFQTDEAVLIADKAKELSASGKVTALKKNADLVINLNDLKAETAYKYIAFGLSEDGTVYGTPASKKFETILDPSVLRKTDTWAISYYGRQEQEGVEYDTFLVECEEGERYYFTTVMKDLLDAYKITIEDYVKSEIEYFPTLLEYYKINDITYTESTVVGGPRMESGTYYGIAIGFDAQGKQTGEYSVAELVIPEEEATAEYSQWLGNWRISDGTRYYDLTVHAYDNNFMYAITGWEEGAHLEVDADGDGELDGFDISTMFTQHFVFPTFYNKGKMDFQEYEITEFYASETSTSADYVLGLFGVGDLQYQGESATNTLIGLTGGVITYAVAGEGDTVTLTGNSLNYEGISIQYKAMGYIGYPLVEGNQNLWLCNEPMMFPLTMTKQAAEAAQMSAQDLFIKKKLEKGKYRKIQIKPEVYKAF